MATYGSETGVEAINAHLTDGYGAATLPTSAQVATWLEQGYAHLNLLLAKAGYSTPVSATVTLYPFLTRLNNLYAAACAEQSTNISTAGPGEETRSAALWTQYRAELADLLDGDLTLAGLTRATTAPVRRRVGSLELRRRDGYAHRFDSENSEYASGSTDDITLLEPWRLGSGGGTPERDY
jgi:hypothetical protein